MRYVIESYDRTGALIRTLSFFKSEEEALKYLEEPDDFERYWIRQMGMISHAIVPIF